MKLRFAMPIAVAATAALTLTACGSDEPTASGYKPTVPPSTATSAPVTTAAPQKVAPVVHLNTASFLPAMKKGMAGKNSVRTTLRMVAGGQTMTVTGVQTMSPVAMQLDMKGAAFDGRMKMILVKDIAYLSTSDLPAGKYLKVDPDSKDPMAATLGSMLDELDPTKTFDAFDAGLQRAQYIKTERLDGRTVDRYAVTVDVAAAMKAQGEKVVAGMPKSLVYTIWMGSADRLMYKVFFEMQGVSATMTASDWGKPVTIKAPAAKDIVRR
jgi:hypothetical protein